MSKNKSKKILATALVLGIPVATTMINQNANAMMRGKKPPLPPKPTITTPMIKPKVKPPVPPKPSSSVTSSKVGSNPTKTETVNVKSLVNKFNELGIISKNSGKSTQSFTPENENKVVSNTLDSLFSSGKPSKPSTPTPTPRKLNLNSKTPSSNASTSAPKPTPTPDKIDLSSKTPSNNTSTSTTKLQQNVGKLDLNSKTPTSNTSNSTTKPISIPGKLSSDAGSHLNRLFENKGLSSPTTNKPTGSLTTSGKPSTTTQNTDTSSSTTTKTSGKLDSNAGSHLNGLFGNKGTSSSTSSNSGKNFENPDPNILKAPSLTPNTTTINTTTTPSTGTPNIPDAPPLPPGGIIPPVKESITSTTNTLTTSNSNKTSSNKTSSNTTVSTSRPGAQAPVGFMDELKLKLNKK